MNNNNKNGKMVCDENVHMENRQFGVMCRSEVGKQCGNGRVLTMEEDWRVLIILIASSSDHLGCIFFAASHPSLAAPSIKVIGGRGPSSS
jgi:hypothetical protein